MLFEIRGQVLYTELFFQLLADLVDPPGVLMGANGEGGGEPVEPVLGGILGRPAHPQPVTDGAPAAPLGLLFQPLHGGVELLRVVVVFHHRYPQRVGGGHELFQLLAPAVVFLRGPGVGVIVEDSDLKILAQLFQHGAGAGPAAGVEQKLWPGGGQRFQHFVHLLCKIQLL